ncbi:kinase RLK-Pelle-DLSV family protein, partial [Tanacetum coccineum]
IEIEAVEAVRANKAIEAIEAVNDFINPYTNTPLNFYTIERVTKATNRFSENLFVGRGGFGNVFACVIDGIPVAVKRLIEGSKQGNAEFENELNFLFGVNHLNVIRLMGYSVSPNEKIIIYEYMSNNSLASFLLDDNKRKHLNWSRRVKIIKGIADGLSYLHNDGAVNLIHRDNIL